MTVSIVTSLYRSDKYILEFCQRIKQTASKIGVNYQIVLVNDGSPDNSIAVALKAIQEDERVELVNLSRNYGQHVAMITGLKFATGDFVFMTDIDLEEPPELMAEFYHHFTEDPSLDHVYGVVQVREKNFFGDIGGRLFYRFFNALSTFRLPQNIAMARLMRRNCVDALLMYSENQVFLGGLFEHIGFKRAQVVIAKSYKGTTTYNFRRKWNLMLDAVTSFSEVPLRFIFTGGILMWLISSVYLVYVLYQKVFNNLQMGWASLFASIWFLGGLVLMALGIIGIYLSKMFLEIKGRPRAIIKSHHRVEK